MGFGGYVATYVYTYIQQQKLDVETIYIAILSKRLKDHITMAELGQMVAKVKAEKKARYESKAKVVVQAGRKPFF